jgi:hypothetical protein
VPLCQCLLWIKQWNGNHRQEYSKPDEHKYNFTYILESFNYNAWDNKPKNFTLNIGSV